MFFKILFRIFLYIWCLPQNLIGFIYTRNRKFKKFVFAPDNGSRHITKNIFVKFVRWLRTEGLPNNYYYKDKGIVNEFGVSLGFYICIVTSSTDNFSIKDLNHENGHRVQSAILGPLYLIFVGLTSLMNFIYTRIYVMKKFSTEESNKKYHDFFVEAWADKLGSC